MAKNPKSPQDKNNFYLKLGRKCASLTEAIQYYTLAIDSMPSVESYLYRAGAYEETKQHEKALDDINMAITLDIIGSLQDTLYGIRANLYEKLGKDDKALADIEHSLSINQKNAITLKLKAFILLKNKQLDEALSIFLDIEATDQCDEDVYLHISHIYALKLDFEGAIKILDRAIEKYPSFVAFFKKRALYLYALNQDEKALEDLTFASILSPNDAELHKLKGNHFVAHAEYDLALENYNLAIEWSPEYSEAYLERALLYKFDKNKTPLGDFNRALHFDPQYTAAYLERGIYYFINGRYLDALSDLHMASELNPNLAESYAWRSKIFIKLNKHDDALKEVKRSLNLKSNDINSLITLQTLYHKKKYFAKLYEIHIYCTEKNIVGFEPLPDNLVPFLTTFQSYVLNRNTKLSSEDTDNRLKMIKQVNDSIKDINLQLKQLGSLDSIPLLSAPPSLKALCSHLIKHHSFFKPNILNENLPPELCEYINKESFNEEVCTPPALEDNRTSLIKYAKF